jgi:hypothetical protein
MIIQKISYAFSGVNTVTPTTGSESHILARCAGSGEGGLECIGGICTRACLTSESSCSDLAGGAVCTNQSVEPGQVAVCDVRCTLDAECASVGGDYGCDAGFCRQAAAGAAGAGGSGSGGACRPLGSYEVGKEGGYLPCCAGLTEISRRSLVQEGDGKLTCEQLELNTYACITGTCGDGTCEEDEKGCGCAEDCPDVPGPARDLQCSPYLDQTPPPVVRQVSITNSGAQTLYIERSHGAACSGLPSLVTVERGGQSVNIYGAGCARTCQGIADRGAGPIPPSLDPAAWEGEGVLSVPCPDFCPPLPLTPIAPGETLTQEVRREIGLQHLPRECAQGIVTESIACYSWLIPQPGVYDIRLRAYADASCNSQACAAIELTEQGDWFFADHTFVLGAPVP